MPLVNCKIHLELNWTKTCVMYDSDAYDACNSSNNNRETTFK